MSQASRDLPKKTCLNSNTRQNTKGEVPLFYLSFCRNIYTTARGGAKVLSWGGGGCVQGAPYYEYFVALFKKIVAANATSNMIGHRTPKYIYINSTVGVVVFLSCFQQVSNLFSFLTKIF